MSIAELNGVRLYYEVTGEGFPLVFCHEFGDSLKSWGPQVNFFSRRYKVITHNYRGFPPSEVPEKESAYSQEILIEDLHQLLRYLDISQAFIGGCSMGGSVTLQFGITHPEMCKGLVIVGAGTGSTDRQNFETKFGNVAHDLETDGWKVVAKRYAREPNRLPLLRKDPRSWQEFYEELSSHSGKGSVLIIRGVIMKRPTIFALETELERLRVPTLIMVGDEDEFCIEPSVFMKRHIPGSGLAVFPQSGHAINLEEPAAFNRTVLDFLTMVEAGKWAAH